MKALWFFAPIHDSVTQIDKKTVKWLKAHSNLVTALLALGIILWVHHPWFTLSVVGIGAFSYFFGISVGFLMSLVLAVMNLVYSLEPSYILTMEPAKLGSYACAAWLGFHHRQQKRIQKQQTHLQNHPDQVVPWTVANEIRTSLASVRYLLFPLQENHKLNEVDILTNELSRLEKMFEQIEKDSINQNATMSK